MKNIVKLNLLKVFILTLLMSACTGGNSSSNGGNNTPIHVSTADIIIDPMTNVPVINGSSTQGTLYIHNYGSEPVSNLQYNLNNSTISSQVRNLLSRVGFNMANGIEDSNGFVLLNPERCQSIGANSSCSINFTTPNLSLGNQGSSLVTINYTNSLGKATTTSQVVNYNYVNGNTTTGVDFTGSLEVNGTAGSTKYVVGYIYAGGAAGGLYKGVNLVSSNPSTRINGGFINNQEVATNQVIAVEFVVAVQNTTNSYVNITPTWSNSANISAASNAHGVPLGLSIVPAQNAVNYIFGNIPILEAAPSTTGTISVVNNGNANGTAITVEKSGGTTDGITVDASGCTTNVPQANGVGSCDITYTVTTYTPGSTTLIYKSNNIEVGRQVVYWLNKTPIPIIQISLSENDISFAKNTATESIPMIRFTLQNIGYTPLQNATFSVNITGVSSISESSGSCFSVSELAISQSCYIDIKLSSATAGIGNVYVRSLGEYNNISYRYTSLPVRYAVTNSTSLTLMPNTSVNLTAGAGGESVHQTYILGVSAGFEPANITGISLESMTTSIQPSITGGTCNTTTVLESSSACTIIVSFSGPLTESQNIVGTTKLRVNYIGGIPAVAGVLSSEQINYTLLSNDSSLSVNITANGLSGIGTESSPYFGTTNNETMQIMLTYTNNSVNYMMRGFNLDTNDLPYGITVGDGNCATGANVGDITIDGECYLNLNIDKTLLQTSAQGGSTVFNFKVPTATWKTSVGFYVQSFESRIYINYLQPSVSFSLSNNNGSFESTVLTMTLANESAGTVPVTVNVSQVRPWLVNQPIASDNCSGVGIGEYSAICDLGGLSGESAQVKYIMPDYLVVNESANIPLIYSTTALVYLSTDYNLISYIEPYPLTYAILTDTNGAYTQCAVAITGILSNTCSSVTLTGINETTGVSVAQDLVYFTHPDINSYTQCNLGVDGVVSNSCVTATISGNGALDNPNGIANDGNHVYILNTASNSYTQCAINDLGINVGTCTKNTPSLAGELNEPYGIAIERNYVYITNKGNNSYTQCVLSPVTGIDATTCVTTSVPELSGPYGISIYDGFVYIANSNSASYLQCKIGISGIDNSSCQLVVATSYLPYDYLVSIGLFESQAYFFSWEAGYSQCLMANDVITSNCNDTTLSGGLNGVGFYRP